MRYWTNFKRILTKLTQLISNYNYSNMESNIIEKLQKIGESISAYLSKTAPAQEPEAKPEPETKLSVALEFADGTKGIADPALQLGATIMATTDEGTMPMADGTYMLADGKTEVTVYEGKISNVTEKNMMDEKMAELQAIMEAKLSAVEKVTEFEVKLSEQNTLIAEQAKMIAELHEIVTELSKKEPTREIPTPNAATKEDRVELMLQNLAQLKKSNN